MQVRLKIPSMALERMNSKIRLLARFHRSGPFPLFQANYGIDSSSGQFAHSYAWVTASLVHR